MRIATKKTLALFSFVLLGSCLGTNLTAADFTIPDYKQAENKSYWVCDYTRGRRDVLFLRCDNLVGLLYDHMLLKDESQSKTTKYIPIWRRADSDNAAIHLVKTVLCDDDTECDVEMNQAWAANFR